MTPRGKLDKIKRLCRQNLPPDLLLFLILVIVFPAQALAMIKR